MLRRFCALSVLFCAACAPTLFELQPDNVLRASRQPIPWISVSGVGGIDSDEEQSAVGDLNSDGYDDLFIVGRIPEIALSDGARAFEVIVPDIDLEDLDIAAKAAAIADLNLDGHMDIFIARSRGFFTNANGEHGYGVLPNMVWINAGTPDSLAFVSGTAETVGDAVLSMSCSVAVAVGDLNADGAPDVFVANMDASEDPGISISQNELLINDGAGFFTSVTTSQATQRNDNSLHVALGDFNVDGHLDIFVGNDWPSNVEMLLNDGAGDFVSSGIPGADDELSDNGEPTFGKATYVAVGDLNADGADDLFVCYELLNRIWINNGAGEFAGSTLGAEGRESRAAAIGDLNNDGHNDIVVSIQNQANELWISDGLGNFDPMQGAVSARSDFSGVVLLSDFDSDGSMDIFVKTRGGSQNEMFFSGSAPGLTSVSPGTIPLTRADRSEDVAIADLNGDGHTDIFIANLEAPNELLLSDGDGDFYSVTTGDVVEIIHEWGEVSERRDWSTCVEFGDLDSDGDLDIYVGNIGGFENTMFFNDGRGNFTLVVGSPATTSRNENGEVLNAMDVAIGDLNGDGHNDIYLANSGSWANPNNDQMFFSDGQGGFVAAPQPPVIRWPTGPASTEPNWGAGGSTGVVMQDFNSDGANDLIVVAREDADSLLLNDGTGTFTASEVCAAHTCSQNGEPNNCYCASQSITSGDINNDGHFDIIITGEIALVNDGTGGFVADEQLSELLAQENCQQGNGNDVAIGDLNSDGAADIVVAQGCENRILLNDGTGVYTEADLGSELSRSVQSSSAVIGDINNDGYTDVFIANRGDTRGTPNEMLVFRTCRHNTMGQFGGDGLVSIPGGDRGDDCCEFTTTPSLPGTVLCSQRNWSQSLSVPVLLQMRVLHIPLAVPRPPSVDFVLGER